MEQAQVAGKQRWIDPQADSGDRTYAVFIHLVFLLAPIPVLPQLIMWLIKKDSSGYIDDHGKEAVNFQISLLLYAAICGPLVIIGIGLIGLLILPWFGIICSILAAIAAGRGEYFRYPMAIRLIS